LSQAIGRQMRRGARGEHVNGPRSKT
jgi:hypothetical protein